jgi:NAD(P)-dependent dehydrogenase (short-subunit alcohol dehydrogenase family)
MTLHGGELRQPMTTYRTILVTGSAHGIGQAIFTQLNAAGHRVIGLDLSDAEVIADLSTERGRTGALENILDTCGGCLDAVIGCAGVASADSQAMIAINYFGMVAILEGLRGLVARSPTPRVVAVSSSSIIHAYDRELVAACLAGDEARAIALGLNDPRLTYASTKVALTRWVRRTSILPDWAGAGVLLNAVAPGVILTRITQPILATEEGRQMLAKVTPIAVASHAHPEDLAHLLTFLASPENRYIVGQTIFADGGSEAILQGDDIPPARANSDVA